MNRLQVTIIGMGPRGLSVLQRIAGLAHEVPVGIQMDIHLVDPGDSGQGAHSSQQPPHLLTNTVASQVTMFSDGTGPSFTEWAHSVGYRRFGTGHYPTGGDGEVIGEHDYLPRKMLGEYLSWVFDRTVNSLPPHLRVIHHRCNALDTRREGPRLVVELEEGFSIHSDFVFLATGHCRRSPNREDHEYEEFVRRNAARNDHLVYLSNPYPLDKLQRLAPATSVAVQGFGLTAHDVVAGLTVGRGGRFEGADGSTRYVPSGREPKILLFSRQCLPLSARGNNQKGITGRHEAKFFTQEALRHLRKQVARDRGSEQLDFEREVLPLLLREMGYAYSQAEQGASPLSGEFEFGAREKAAIEAILDPLQGRIFTEMSAFKNFFVNHLVEDLDQAEMGNLGSPVKAATDVIRDTRQSLRSAVEFGGLTPDSHRVFNSKYIPLMNRVSFGPPKQRNYELLALLESGVVDLAGGPGCRLVTDDETARFAIESEFSNGAEKRFADALVIARLDMFQPELDDSRLMANLLRRELVRPYANGSFLPGGLDIEQNGRLVTATGEALPNAWAVGYLTEGPRYYTYYLPRARMSSRFTVESDECVRDMISQIGKQIGSGEDEHANSDRREASVS